MNKVMLIGDSIRMSYQPAVQRSLAGEAEVWGPADNCRFAKYTLWEARGWIGQCGTPNLIHWNNGIWDVYHHTGDSGVFTPLEEYVLYLKRVLAVLRQTGATVVWATTTPVKPQCQSCFNEEIDRYNAEAVRLMGAEHVEVHDLNGLLRTDLDRFIAADNVHLSEAGIAACGDAVARLIRKRQGLAPKVDPH
jgi:hypothetical protein